MQLNFFQLLITWRKENAKKFESHVVMQIIPEKLPPTHFSTIYVGNDKLEIDLLLAMLISSVHDG